MGVWCYAKVYFVSGLHFCNPYREWSPVLLCFLRLFGLHFVTRELDAEIIEAGLQMSYNLCNLPKQITAEDGTLVNYTYFADGTKCWKSATLVQLYSFVFFTTSLQLFSCYIVLLCAAKISCKSATK